MSARLLREWQTYAAIEPFGQPAAFWRTGLTVATLANVNRRKKTDKSYGPEDFMPRSMVEQSERGSSDIGQQTLRVFEDLAELKKHGEQTGP
jgi:hypothetical protein